MGFSLGGSSSDSESESQFSNNINPEQLAAMQQYWGMLPPAMQQAMQGVTGQIPGATNWMNQMAQQSNPAFQQQLGGGATQDMGLQTSLMNSLNQSLNQPSNMSQINASIMGGSGNNYADAMKGQYMQDAQDAQNQMLQGLDARAAASGMSGGSRHGTATAQGMQDINKNLQGLMAGTGYQTFDKDLDRKLGIAEQADSNNLARQQMMAGMIGGQDQAQQYGLNASGQMQNLGMGSFAPYGMYGQMLSPYANMYGDAIMESSGSSSSGSDSKSFGVGF